MGEVEPTDELNPYRSPEQTEYDDAEPELPPLPSYRPEKDRVLWALLIVWAIGGALAVFVAEDLSRIVDVAAGIATVILILRWCDYDRQERAINRWPFFGVMMILCPGPALVLPIYFLRTRGLRGLWSTAKAFGFFVLMVTVAALGMLGASVLMWE